MNNPDITYVQCSGEYCDLLFPSEGECRECLKKALETDDRDVPMKPVKSAIPRYGMGYEYFDWICPVCKKRLAYEPDKESIPKRCKNCGQLIETH